MKDLPKIAPELRGLLEEIVADSRSAIRLVPRRALRTWFESGEISRARDVSTTRAEKHLIEAYREALAEMLLEAAIIAYWKAPVLAQRPIGADGKPYDPASKEPAWNLQTRRSVTAEHPKEGVDLLRACLDGIRPDQGWRLAQGALLLAPSDRARCYSAANIPWSRPRSAIAAFERLAGHVRPASYTPVLLLNLGARQCSLDRYEEARESYRASSRLDPEAPFGCFYSFNLSCVLGDESSAIAEATEISKRVPRGDPRVSEASRVIREWTGIAGARELTLARNTSRRISERIPEAASALCRALET